MTTEIFTKEVPKAIARSSLWIEYVEVEIVNTRGIPIMASL